MNPIEKMLKKFTEKERSLYKEIIQRLERGDTLGLDIKQLKGNSGIYRVKKQKVRIIFRYGNGGHVTVLALDCRSDTTYRDF